MTREKIKFGAFDISKHTLDETTKEMLRRHLSASGGNKNEAARTLGVCKRTVRNWLKRWKDVRYEFYGNTVANN
jgi:transcriptional regulator with PAS, ATPase and Fis domain